MATQEKAALDTVRADQVGSLLRPDWLKEAWRKYGEGQIGEQEMREAQDRAIREAIEKQESLDYPVLTDGEMRRLSFQDSFGAAVEGYASTKNTIQFHEQRVAQGHGDQKWDPGYAGQGPAIVHRLPAVERIHLVRNQPLEEYRYSSSLTSRPVKVTLIGPDRIIQRFDWQNSRTVYPDIDQFVSDVVDTERQMIGSLVEAGCRYVQIDAPSYTAYVDQASLDEMRARGEDPAQNMERSISADNAIIADFPGVTFGIHLCRGNQRSMWHREGAYDAIAEKLFNGLKHKRFLLEYDTERAGTFEPLRFMPRDKVVVLGLVTTKKPDLENPDTLKRRIEEASRYVPIENLALSPQCGFASDIAGNLLSEDDQWRKLELVQRVAREVWG